MPRAKGRRNGQRSDRIRTGHRQADDRDRQSEANNADRDGFVRNARLQGIKPLRIILVHILPNARISILTAAAIGFNNAVLAEASMSYLGLGVQPPTPSLGRMLFEAQSFLLNCPWYAIFPGVTIILMILGAALLSEGFKEVAGV